MTTLIDRLTEVLTEIAANIKALGLKSWTTLKLSADVAVSTTAFASTGLSFTGEASSVYEVEVYGAYQAAATTTGIGLALDIPSGSVVGTNIVHTSATAIAGVQQIADATTTSASTGVTTASTNTPIWGKWLVSVGTTAGTVSLRVRSEVASSAVTLKGGLMFMKYRKLT